MWNFNKCCCSHTMQFWHCTLAANWLLQQLRPASVATIGTTLVRSQVTDNFMLLLAAGAATQFVAAFTYDGGNLIGSGKYRLRLFDYSKELSKGLVADVCISVPGYPGMPGAGVGQTMVHDIGTTERYIVVVNSPVFMDMKVSRV